MAVTEYIIGVSQGNFYDFWNAGVVTTPTALTGGSARFTSTTNNVGLAVLDHIVYAADGVGAMCRYNGLTVSKAGSSPPTAAPTFSAFVGAGVLTGNVQYKITYLDALGKESEPSSASATLAPVAQNVTLTIPNDTDSDRSGKNVYRLGPTGTTYKLVNSSPISATATTYTDSVADASLGDTLVSGNTLFPSCSCLWEHDNRLVGCGNVADVRTLFVSNEFAPWYCPSTPDDTDPTQGIRIRIQGKNARLIGGISHGGYCFVFTDEGGYILQGTSSDDYRVERFTNHGCVSHRSICTVRNWLFWVGPDGIYRYDGEDTVRVDNSIRTFFLSKSASNLAQTAAWVYDDRYYVSFPSGSTPVMSLDVRQEPENGWCPMEYQNFWLAATGSQSQSSNPGVPRVFVADQTQGQVMQLEAPATYDDTPTGGGAASAISVEWASKQINMGLSGRDKRVNIWGFKLRTPTSLNGASTSNVTASLYAGSGATAIQTKTFALSTTSAGDDWAVDPSTGLKVAVIREEAVEQARSEIFQLGITHSVGGTGRISDFRLLEAEAYWKLAS
jgi:hypothetical protein